jgi:hypothetical protein
MSEIAERVRTTIFHILHVHDYKRVEVKTTEPDGVVVERFECSCGEKWTKYWPSLPVPNSTKDRLTLLEKRVSRLEDRND